MTLSFDPKGTARQRAGLAATAETQPPFPRALAARLERNELGAASVSLAWELARLSGDGPDASAALLVLLLLLDASRLGSTALDLAERARVLARAELLSFDPVELAAVGRGLTLVLEGKLLTALIGAPAESGRADARHERRPLVRTGTQLALARHVALEERLASLLGARARAVRPSLDAIAAPLPPLASMHGPVALTDEQIAAVHAAISGRQIVIAGGPGTGKTSIVAAIVRALAGGSAPEVPPASVALAAPTGKAADRLFASLSLTLANERSGDGRALLDLLTPAQTLHRLLGYRAHDDTFTFHGENPLPHRLVVVDEASMLDLALAERLVSALALDARLVLLGDPDQLPSVDAGAVLGDLVATSSSAADPVMRVARLTRSHRMDASDVSGAHVLAVAARIRAGQIGALDALEGPVAAAEHASGVGLFTPDALGLDRFLRAYYARVFAPILDEAATPIDLSDEADRARVMRLFLSLGRSRLLTVTRGPTRATGAEAVNAVLAREVHGARAGWAFAPGEPLLAVRNDYDRELMNGDQGLVTTAPTGELFGVFVRAGRIVSHPLESIRSTVERAYATTVHKAQGSEHDHVALLLPEDDMLTLGRELVYTAVTRARKSALIVGDPSVLARAVKRASHRVTGLRNALARNGQPGPGD
jgi:exodeoxyribonuclease V alpha subunit